MAIPIRGGDRDRILLRWLWLPSPPHVCNLAARRRGGGTLLSLSSLTHQRASAAQCRFGITIDDGTPSDCALQRVPSACGHRWAALGRIRSGQPGEQWPIPGGGKDRSRGTGVREMIQSACMQAPPARAWLTGSAQRPILGLRPGVCLFSRWAGHTGCCKGQRAGHPLSRRGPLCTQLGTPPRPCHSGALPSSSPRSLVALRIRCSTANSDSQPHVLQQRNEGSWRRWQQLCCCCSCIVAEQRCSR